MLPPPWSFVFLLVRLPAARNNPRPAPGSLPLSAGFAFLIVTAPFVLRALSPEKGRLTFGDNRPSHTPCVVELGGVRSSNVSEAAWPRTPKTTDALIYPSPPL